MVNIFHRVEFAIAWKNGKKELKNQRNFIEVDNKFTWIGGSRWDKSKIHPHVGCGCSFSETYYFKMILLGLCVNDTFNILNPSIVKKKLTRFLND